MTTNGAMITDANSNEAWADAARQIRAIIGLDRDADELAQEALCLAWNMARSCAEHGIRVLGVHDTGQRSLSGLRIYWIAAEAGFPPGILVQGGMRPELVGSPDDIEDRLRERIASGPAPLGLKRPEDN